MPKKILFILLTGVLILTACQSETTTPQPSETPTPEMAAPTAEETAELPEPTAVPETIEPVPGEKMPCSTVYDYEMTPEMAEYQAVADQLPPVTEEDWIKGDPDAPVTIVEYADFQCPACGNFSFYVAALLDAFPETIRVVFRHMPLPSIHPLAYISSMAAEAAGAQEKFWEMHDLLYATQSEWSGLSEEAFMTWVLTQAETLELDLEAFETVLNDADLRADLEQTTEDRLALGLHYTPFVVVNDMVFRNNQPDLFGLIGIYAYGGFEECPDWVIEPGKDYTAILDTSAGEIEISLFPEVAPLAVNSFVFLAQNGWYEDVYFHRVIEGFVAQAGDPSGLGVLGPGYTFANETANALSFESAGILGMANSGPDTNGSQFFITLGPAQNLDRSYTIFGQVTEESLSVLDEIALRDPQMAVGFEDATIINGIDIIEE